MKVLWSEQARNSLANIYEYIYQDSPEAAEKVLDTLTMKANTLSDSRVEYPIDPVLDNEKYRYYLQWSFKIIYERTENIVIIIDIFHTRQDPGKFVL
jgi:plasmid stabilization system protein ParE